MVKRKAETVTTTVVKKRGAGSAYATSAFGPLAGGYVRVPGPVAKLWKPGRDRTSGFYQRFGKGKKNKFFETAVSFLVDSTGEVPATGQLNLVPTGTSEITRIGSAIIVKEIQFRGIMQMAPAASAQASSFAIIYLVLDKQCNGAAAAVTDVLTSNSLATALTNLGTTSRFSILKKWRVPFNATAGVTTAYCNITKNWEWTHKCNIPIQWDTANTDGSIGSIKSNNLFLLAGSDGYSDDLIGCTAICRLRFEDAN